MNETEARFAADLRASPRPVLIVMVLLGCSLVIGAQALDQPGPVVEEAVRIFFLCCAVCLTGWLLHGWRAEVGQWFTVLGLFGVINLIAFGLEYPAAMVLVTIPVLLSPPLIGLANALRLAAAQAVLLVIALWAAPADASRDLMSLSLLALGATVGALIMTLGPVEQLTRWLEQYFRRGEQLLEEARVHREAAEQHLAGLAHANRQLTLLNERLAALRAAAEETERSKSAFVANVSHEFRTPLNMIIGLVELIIESPQIYTVVLPPELRKDLEVVYRNCQHLSDMIDDVLDLSRAEAGRLALRREWVDLRDLVESSVIPVRPLLDIKGLSCELDLPADLPLVFCDRTRIRQVVLNLVSNAARFTDEGGISIRLEHQNSHVVVSMSDSGPGISPEDARRIFEPFSQGSDQLQSQRGGSGLGLSISERFVRLHGGRMWLESQLGVGTTFHFTLPVSIDSRSPIRPTQWISEDWIWREADHLVQQVAPVDRASGRRIVVCDAPGALYTEMLQARDQEEWIELPDLVRVVQEIERVPAHAIILNLDGSSDLLRTLAQVAEHAPSTPVIGCTVPNFTQRALEAGARGYLTKPVTLKDMEKVLATAGRQGEQVLVVDDDPDVLDLFSRMLLACDPALKVVTARSGQEALDLLEQEMPGLILLDIILPDMDGWQVLGRLRELGIAGRTPIFFVSAQDPVEHPATAPFIAGAIAGGLPLSHVLSSAMTLATLLSQTQQEPGPEFA